MDIPPAFVESVTKERHLNPALIWWFVTLFGYALLHSTANYIFQQAVLRKIHKRLFRRFGKTYPIPPPVADDLSSSVTPQQQQRYQSTPSSIASDELPPSATKKQQ